MSGRGRFVKKGQGKGKFQVKGLGTSKYPCQQEVCYRQTTTTTLDQQSKHQIMRPPQSSWSTHVKKVFDYSNNIGAALEL